MVFVIQAEEALLFLFNLGKEAIPWDYIVLVFVIEDHLSVDEIFNNLLTAAVQQEIGPGRLYSYALLVMVNKRILMEVKRRSLIDVEWGCTEENYEYQDGVDPSRHNWAFTKTEMPNLKNKDKIVKLSETKSTFSLTSLLKSSGMPKQVFSPILYKHRLQRCTAFLVRKKTMGRMNQARSPKTKNVPRQIKAKNWLTSCST